MKKYYTYILLTEKNTFYCGFTDDVKKRFKAHIEGKGAKYTKANKPVKVVYYKEFKKKTDALKEERRIKKLSHKEKLNLIKTNSFFSLLTVVFRVLLILFVLIFLIFVALLLLAQP